MIRHLLVPGLLGPLPQAADAARAPRLPAIERVLARADRLPGERDFTAQACALFGLRAEDGSDLPTGALRYALDAGVGPQGWVLQADPAHLRPDQDRLLLFDAGQLDITPGEAAALVDAFNRHFSADGLRLAAPTPRRWYLLADQDPEIQTVPLFEAAGRNVNRLLPRGRRRRFWTGLLNEVQMLFHAVDANAVRESRGRPAINGLWFSGAGRMPRLAATRLRQTDAAGAAGGLLDALFAASPAHGDEPLAARTAALRALMDADPAGWTAAVTEVERELPGMLAGAEELRLYPCVGACYRWRRAHAARWWRRPRPLAAGALAADAEIQTR